VQADSGHVTHKPQMTRVQSGSGLVTHLPQVTRMQTGSGQVTDKRQVTRMQAGSDSQASGDKKAGRHCSGVGFGGTGNEVLSVLSQY
jgi:hypothetical protein